MAGLETAFKAMAKNRMPIGQCYDRQRPGKQIDQTKETENESDPKNEKSDSGLRLGVASGLG